MIIVAKKNQKKLDTRSEAFKIQKMRRELINVLNDELYIFLSTLYGIHFEEGRKRIKDFGNLTMFDIASEIKLRTVIMRGYNTAKVKQHFGEERDKQNKLLAQLKASL